MKTKIVPNPDKEFFKKISQAVKDNNNWCPCTPFKDDDHLCLCAEFRNSEPDIEKGEKEIFCHCKRYKKIIVEE